MPGGVVFVFGVVIIVVAVITIVVVVFVNVGVVFVVIVVEIIERQGRKSSIFLILISFNHISMYIDDIPTKNMILGKKFNIGKKVFGCLGAKESLIRFFFST